MLRCLRFAVLAVLAASCLDYEIKVVTAVDRDAVAERRVAIREKHDADAPRTWSAFAPPAAPYRLTGSEAEGFVAAARLAPGSHPTGLDRLVERAEGEYAGAAGAAGLEVAPSRLTVAQSDVGVGVLYRYRETVGTGADPVAARIQVREWLAIGLDVLVRGCELMLPEHDWPAVRTAARRDLLPRLEASLVVIHRELAALVEEGLGGGLGPGLEDWLGGPRARLILAEAGRWGFRPRPGSAPPRTLPEFFAVERWALGDALLAEFLSPLSEAGRQQAGDLLRRKEFWQDLKVPAQELYPDDHARAVVEARLRRFAVAGLGAYLTLGLFDRHRLEFTVTLPGEVLATNGVPGPGRVDWVLEELHLALDVPVLFAVSFVPRPAFAGGRCSMTDLLALERDLAAREDADDGLAAALAAAAADGWDAALDAAGKDQELRRLVERARRAVGG